MRECVSGREQQTRVTGIGRPQCFWKEQGMHHEIDQPLPNPRYAAPLRKMTKLAGLP